MIQRRRDVSARCLQRTRSALRLTFPHISGTAGFAPVTAKREAPNSGSPVVTRQHGGDHHQERQTMLFFFVKVNIKKINKQKSGVVVVKRAQKTRPPPTAALRFFFISFFFLWLSLDISVSLCYTFTIAPTDIRRIAFIKVRRVSNPSIITSVNSGRRARHHEGEKRRLKQRRRLRILSEPFNQRGGARRRLCRRRRRHQPRCPASMLTCKSPSSSH